MLSCVAAIQALLIMMSQNRQEEKDRRRAENDYKVNLKTEIMIEDLYDKVNAILAKQSALEKKLQEKEMKEKSEDGKDWFRWKELPCVKYSWHNAWPGIYWKCKI